MKILLNLLTLIIKNDNRISERKLVGYYSNLWVHMTCVSYI